jgi:hypothetical protein
VCELSRRLAHAFPDMQIVDAFRCIL